jgi:BolA family transcriptional regulator, general stress-responsive regulator
MKLRNRIEEKLRAAFAPTHLEIIDESHKHAGHVGAPAGSSETHLGFTIVSQSFEGQSRLARSRAVHAALAQEIPLFHAITLMRTLTPAEFSAL